MSTGEPQETAATLAVRANALAVVSERVLTEVERDGQPSALTLALLRAAVDAYRAWQQVAEGVSMPYPEHNATADQIERIARLLVDQPAAAAALHFAAATLRRAQPPSMTLVLDALSISELLSVAALKLDQDRSERAQRAAALVNMAGLIVTEE